MTTLDNTNNVSSPDVDDDDDPFLSVLLSGDDADSDTEPPESRISESQLPHYQLEFASQQQQKNDTPRSSTSNSNPFFQADEMSQEDIVKMYCQSCFLCCMGIAITLAVVLSTWNLADFDDDKVLEAIQGPSPGFIHGGGIDSSLGADGGGDLVGVDDPLDHVIDLTGGASCSDIVESIYWPTETSGLATVLGNTATEEAANTAPGTTFCNINRQSPGLWYSVRGRNARLNVTLSLPISDDQDGNQPQDSSTSWEHIRMSVLRGNCQPDSGSITSMQCMARREVETSRLQQQHSQHYSSLEFYGANGVLYYIYVQGVAPTDRGAFQMTLRRGWNIPSNSDLDGSVKNGTLGVSVALSGDGSLLAASAPFANNLNGPRSGHIRFFERQQQRYIETTGAALLGPSNHTIFGFNLDLAADGRTLAVIKSDALSIYHAIQQGSTATLSWRQAFMVETDNFDTHAPGSVAISADGNTVAWNVHVDDESRGYVEVYQRVVSDEGDSWKRKGELLALGTFAGGNAYDKAVGLSASGNNLVMAGPDNTARMYVWRGGDDLDSGRWVVRGDQVFRSATSVAISGNGNCLAAGLGGDQNTQVKVYCFAEDDSSQQVGQTLVGSTSNFGHSLSFSRGASVLAIGAPWYDVTSSRRDSGQAFIYQFNSATRRWVQTGTLQTAVENDLYGWSVDLADDGSAMAVGVPFHRGSDLFHSGMAQVANVYL